MAMMSKKMNNYEICPNGCDEGWLVVKDTKTIKCNLCGWTSTLLDKYCAR